MRRVPDLLVWLALAVVAGLLFPRIASRDAYDYDEADYLGAVSKGFLANYTDRDAISLATFAKLGLGRGFEKTQRTSLSQYIRESGELPFYRHYHGPLYFYYLIPFRALLGDNEFAMRAASFAFLPLAAILAYLTVLSLRPRGSRLGPALAAAMVVLGPSNLGTAAQITPHSLYVFTCLLGLLAIARLIEDPTPGRFYCSVLVLSLNFMVIEYALLLLLTLATAMFVTRRHVFLPPDRRIGARRLAAAALLFAGTVFAVWPGAWIKLTLVRNYVFFAYFAIVRGGEYGKGPFWQSWLQRAAESPIEYAVIVAGLLLLLPRARRRAAVLPYLVYAGLIFLCTVRNTSSSPTYVSSLLPPLHVLSVLAVGAAAERFSRGARACLLAALACALLGSTSLWLRTSSERIRPTETVLKQVVAHLKAEAFPTGSVAVDRVLLPTIHYYLPDGRFSAFSETTDSLDETCGALAQSEVREILYAGPHRREMDAALRRHFAVRPGGVDAEGRVVRWERVGKPEGAGEDPPGDPGLTGGNRDAMRSQTTTVGSQ